MERTDRVGSSSDAGHQGIRKPAVVLFLELLFDFVSDHALEISHDGRKGVGTDGGTDQVVRVTHVRDPVGHGFVDGILQRALTFFDGHDLGAERVHSEDVQLLPFAIHGTHVNGAIQSQHGAHRGRCDTVLTGTRLRDDARLAELLRQQGLSDRVVDLVGARVGQILPLQPDGGSSGQFGQTLRLVERRGSAHEFSAESVDFGDELGIVFDLIVRFFDFLEGHG
mmetsp:Transcript_21890/g.52082  ORF Transcript_21890/g.52082 Transcript_21890/m.52082 type:complete len:224 (-) Transcript_21890:1277-1948(-)